MKTHLCVLFPLIFSSVTPAHAALLAYDGFDSSLYNAVPSGSGGGYKRPDTGPSNALFFDSDTVRNNSSVEIGQNPVTHGFIDPWRYNHNISSSVYPRLEATQLSYPGLTTTTGQLNLQRSGSSSGTAKTFARSLNVGPSTGFGSVLYIGGLIQRTSGTTFTLNLSLTDGTSSRSITMAIDADGITALRGSNAPNVTSTSPLWEINTPEFFVLKMENSVLDGAAGGTEGDQLSLYINPDLSSEGANVPALILGDAEANFFVTGNGNWSMGSLTIGSNMGEAGHSAIFDEFKIGTEWADMLATIPEPGTVAFGFVTLLFACRRRRWTE
jgi:hypothetical protein